MDRVPARPGGILYGEDLFWYCQWLAETRYPATSGQGKRPSGALIYYVVRLVIMRMYPGAILQPDAGPVPAALAEPFLELAPQIARRLAIELKHALRLIDRRQVAGELQRVMRSFARLTLPSLSWADEHHVGIYEPLRLRLQSLWETFWAQAQGHHLALLPLLLRLRPQYLLVRPLAPPSMPGEAALQLLRLQLEQDRTDPRWATPPPGCYLYDEPLQDWLLRPLLTGQLFIDLCQVVAELTRAVPALARKRSADLGVGEEGAESPETDAPTQATLRRIPIRPQGTATGAAIAFYAIAAWRVARHAARARVGAPAHSAGEKPTEPDEPTPPDPALPEDSGDDAERLPAAADESLILPDQQRMPLSQFQQLLAFAMQAAEHLLWDDTLAVRALPPPAPEQRRVLRRLLLSARLRRQHGYLSQKERQPYAPTQAELPAWAAWEVRRDATCDDLARRLADSIAPASITSASLPDLLRTPATALVRQYVYQMPLGAWLRDALQAHLPDGNALLLWCRALVEALAEKLGAWPPNVQGAPNTLEQAARAVWWYTKLALEARIDRLPDFAAPADLPQRDDGGLVIWLGSILPVEAAELACIAAPLITRMLYRSAWEAANQREALFVALVKAREPRSFKWITDELTQRAEDLKLPSSAEAVLQALEKLEHLLEHLLLPDEISSEHLIGNKFVLTSIDLIVDYHYNIDHGCYQFIGDFRAFVLSFIRPQEVKEADDVDLTNIAAPGRPEVSAIALDPAAENEAALRVLALLLRQAQTPQDGELSRDARRLIEWVFTTNNGRQLIKQFARQGKAVAIALTKLWQADTLPTEGAEPAISPRQEKKQMKQQVALARFLAAPAVQQSPALRRAVGDLFEISLGIETPRALGLRLGTLEHLAAWVARKALREEALRIMEALAQVSPTQRKALCARLLSQEQIVLTLHLLQQRGWSRPPWLRSLAAEQHSPQNFLHARQSWQRRLAENDTSWRARALMAEWLRTQFWHPTWSAHLHEEHIASFHRTLLDALHPRLRAAIGAAGMVAWEQKLAPFGEVIGVEGCLPTQLPAQLDDAVYFEAMWNHLKAGERLLYGPLENDEPGEQQLRWLRQDWQIARLQTHLWFLTLAGLADENEQRILLAALSLANGNARLVGRWIDGQPPTTAETEQLLDHLKRWNPHTALTLQDIPDLLSSAAEQVQTAWAALGAAPIL
ncbi:MAG TPA: hypothetical protein VKT82_26400 [Ktedonobacterales bacterium]|nr:hypothetical protein [Ktedonobacterales bacterium]